MADGIRMNQMAELIVVLKKNVEKNEKLLEKVEKRLEINDNQVKNQLSDFMQNFDKKFEAKWEELLKSMACLTMAVEKGKSICDLGNQQHVLVTMEARTDDNIQIMEFPNDVGMKKGICIEERDIPGSSTVEEWQRRSTFPQNFSEFSFLEAREQRRPWIEGNYDHFLQEERQQHRGPPEFHMQRVQHPVHH